MAYSSVSKTITGAVSVEDVQNALGNSSTDIRTLYTDSNINPWARWKPVYINESFGTGVGPGPLTVAQRQLYDWGTMIDSAYEGDNFGDIQGWIDDMFGSKTDSEIAQLIAHSWAKMRPVAAIGNMHCRLQDFTAHNGDSLISSHGYYVDAFPHPTKVYDGSYTPKRTSAMAGPLFADGSRNVEIAEDASSYAPTEIPTDSEFISWFAQSEDLSVNQQAASGFHTDFLNDAGDSLSIFETIVASGGVDNLIRQGPDVMEANCTRGVVLLKRNGSTNRWTEIAYNKCRNNLSENPSTHAIDTNNDDNLYYKKFIIHWYTSEHYFAIMPDTSSGTTSNTPFTDDVLENLAKWLCFGQYDASTKPDGGTGNDPWTVAGGSILSTGTDAASYLIYGTNDVPTYRTSLLQRAKAGLYNAMIKANGKYLDLKYKSLSDWYVGMYEASYVKGSNSVEEDNLVGDLLVVEYYKRFLETSSPGTVSPYVAIPGYIYQINISRPSSSTGTWDIDGKIHFANNSTDGIDRWVTVYARNANWGTPGANVIIPYLATLYSKVEVEYGGATPFNLLDEQATIPTWEGAATYDGLSYYVFHLKFAQNRPSAVILTTRKMNSSTDYRAELPFVSSGS